MGLKSYNFHWHSYTRENFTLFSYCSDSNVFASKTQTSKPKQRSKNLKKISWNHGVQKSLSKDFKDVLSIKNVVSILEDNINRPWNECRSKPGKPSKKVLFIRDRYKQYTWNFPLHSLTEQNDFRFLCRKFLKTPNFFTLNWRWLNRDFILPPKFIATSHSKEIKKIYLIVVSWQIPPIVQFCLTIKWSLMKSWWEKRKTWPKQSMMKLEWRKVTWVIWESSVTEATLLNNPSLMTERKRKRWLKLTWTNPSLKISKMSGKKSGTHQFEKMSLAFSPDFSRWWIHLQNNLLLSGPTIYTYVVLRYISMLK